MIGRLRGRVAPDEVSGLVLVDVGGVGYEVTTPAGALGRAKRVGDDVELVIHTHVREDAFELFGFASDRERQVFRLLLSVPNVGPKTALGVLSALPIGDLSRAVRNGDVARLTKVPGIGKRTAERLVVELKDKLTDAPTDGTTPSQPAGTARASPAERAHQHGLPSRRRRESGHEPRPKGRLGAARRSHLARRWWRSS